MKPTVIIYGERYVVLAQTLTTDPDVDRCRLRSVHGGTAFYRDLEVAW